MPLEPEAVREVIARGEGREVEFKRGLPRDEKTARTLCAFANTRGGILLIGVDDDHRVIGAGKAAEVERGLCRIASEGIEPTLEVEVGRVRLAEGTLVYCSVPLSRHRPHAVLHATREPEVVVRVGSSNRVADGPTLKALSAGAGRRTSLDPLEKRVLEWISLHNRRSAGPGGDATVAGFAKARNIGLQRARRAFVSLERSGRLVGHGPGAHRIYHLP